MVQKPKNVFSTVFLPSQCVVEFLRMFSLFFLIFLSSHRHLSKFKVFFLTKLLGT